jgi:hypothetical protein
VIREQMSFGTSSLLELAVSTLNGAQGWPRTRRLPWPGARPGETQVRIGPKLHAKFGCLNVS